MEQLDQGGAGGQPGEGEASLSPTLLGGLCGCGVLRGPGLVQQWPHCLCSRIQSNYMALQRINQELEDKLYRMVRATTRCPMALPGTLSPQL